MWTAAMARTATPDGEGRDSLGMCCLVWVGLALREKRVLVCWFGERLRRLFA